jgi:hypothetical protein
MSSVVLVWRLKRYVLVDVAKMATTDTINIPHLQCCAFVPNISRAALPACASLLVAKWSGLTGRALVSLPCEAVVFALPWSPREQPDAVPQAYIKSTPQARKSA